MNTLKSTSFTGVKDLLERMTAGEVFYTHTRSTVFYHEARISPIRFLHAGNSKSVPLTVHELNGLLDKLYTI